MVATLPKLTQKTWQDVKYGLQGALGALGAFVPILVKIGSPAAYPTRPNVPPVAATQAQRDAAALYDSRQQQCATWIVVAAGVNHRELLQSLIATSDAQSMWDALITKYERNDASGRVRALLMLIFATRKPTDTWATVTETLNAYSTAYLAVQPAVFDAAANAAELKLVTLLRNIPAEHPVRTLLMSNRAITYDLAVETIMTLENADEIDPSVTSSLRAFAPTTKSTVRSPSSSTNSSASRKCAFCELTSHSIENCYRMQEYKALWASEKSSGIFRNKDGSIKNAEQLTQMKNRSRKPKERGNTAVADEEEEYAGNASLFTSDSQTSANAWTADSGASRHMTFRRDWLQGLVPDHRKVRLADGAIVYSAGIGYVDFYPTTGTACRIHNVLLVPDLKTNLISITYLTRVRGFDVHFSAETVEFLRQNVVIFTATITSNNVPYLDGETEVTASAATSISDDPAVPITVWHARFAHRHFALLDKMKTSGAILDFRVQKESTRDPVCEPCIEGKFHRAPHTEPAERATIPLGRIVTDVHGPLDLGSRTGSLYWITFIDEYSGYAAVSYMRHKSEAFACYNRYVSYVENQTDHKIKKMRDDKGGEYMSDELKAYCNDRGIHRERTIRDTPQQNGLAERFNSTLAQAITAMLSQARLPRSMWQDAASAYIHVHNRTPSNSRGFKTPHELFLGKVPSVKHLRIWGCLAYVHLQKDQRPPLSARAKRCVFIRYAEEAKGWIFYDTENSREITSDSALFVEDNFPGTIRGKIPSIAPQNRIDPPGPDPIPAHMHPFIPPAPPPFPPNAPPPPPQQDHDPHIPPSRPLTPELPLGPPNSVEPQAEPQLILRIPGRQERLHRREVELAQLPREVRGLYDNFDAREEPFHPRRGPMGDDGADDDDYNEARLAGPNGGEEVSDNPAPTTSSPLAHTIFVPDTSSLKPGTKCDIYPIESISIIDGLDFAFHTSTALEPNTLKEAYSREDAEQYIDAAISEIKAHLENGTWELAKLPHGRRAIGSRWVFKVKRDENGKVERYKARIVAKGYAQREGIDYTDTFAPTARFAALRTVIALAAAEDLELESIDISTAFLNGNIDAEVYMRIPEGLEVDDEDQHGWVLRLLKSLYGIKQAPRIWSKKLKDELDSMGFERLDSDHSVFIYERDSVKLIVPIHVDDLVIASRSKSAISEFKSELSKRFKLRDQGPTTFLLGIKLERDRSKHMISLSQPAYIQSILDQHMDVDEFNPPAILVPMLEGLRLSEKSSPTTRKEITAMEKIPYREVVGKLLYLAIATRPDISYAVGVLCRFNANPGLKHWAAATHLLRYLKATKDLKLIYMPSDTAHPFVTHCDADLGGNPDNHRSTSGFVTMVGGAAVNWGSRLQRHTSLSSVESEYTTACATGCEMMWMRYFLEEIGYDMTTPSPLYTDSASAIQVVKNPEHITTMKHVHRAFHWIRERAEAKDIIVSHVPGVDNVADIFTKPLGKVKFSMFRDMLGLRY
jgi:hypothetical protein